MEDIHIVLLGVGILPCRVAGDKNFQLALASALRRRGARVTLASIAEPCADEWPAGVEAHFLPRPMHRCDHRFYKRDRQGEIVGYHHRHWPAWELLELALTLELNRGRLRRLVQGSIPTVFHWTDLSLMTPLLRRLLQRDAKLACSLLRHVPHGRVLDALRARAIQKADMVFTSTNCSRRRLENEGCRRTPIHIAPWGAQGVDLPAAGFALPAAMADDGQAVHFLWAGFMQQIGERDLFRTLEMARRVLAARSGVRFTFSLKPEFFRPGYKAHECSGLSVQPGSGSFLAELPRYDALLSPLSASASTVAPPLTWLEALSAGRPIVTTACAGIGEVIVHGCNGLVLEDYPSLESFLASTPNLKQRLRALSLAARESFEAGYSLDKVADNYLRKYRECARQ